ncbi:helix-turn-helix domain-containing protein [Chloroflexi bacterium TSY]|nr:helix-turn-helix domain-containing protein [Chloroflexi bacterium TSY]
MWYCYAQPTHSHTSGPISVPYILSVDTSDPDAIKVLKALASKVRLRILDLLGDQLCNVSEISKALDIPLSTATLHIGVLEEAGLIKTELQPAERGLQKLCARPYNVVNVNLPRTDKPQQQTVELSMPVGNFVNCQVTPSCGLATEKGIIGLFDDPTSFYEPERMDAHLVWFHTGFLEYRFPNRLPPKSTVQALQISMEICSEAPLHHDDWPSDITLWINDQEVCTWTSPADFGAQRGLLTPEWWVDHNTQYGLLKVWQVRRDGSYVDGMKLSAVTVDDLCITEHDFISVRIGVKDDARHIGGINIFGSRFGNYPQDLIMRLDYEYL